MNFERLKEPYLLTGIVFIILVLMASFSIELRNILSLVVVFIFTLIIHYVICKKLNINTSLNEYIGKIFNKISSKKL